MNLNRTLFIALLAALALSACHKPFYIQQRSSSNYSIDTTLAQDTNILAMLRPYKTGVDTQMLVVIGHTEQPLTKAQPECTLGNFMADAQFVAGRQLDPKVVASVVNYGGIRLPYLAPGNLTRGDMYELMPFDNMLAIVEIPGAVLQTFCDHMAAYRGWPVSGITYVIKDKKATDVKINGTPVNEHIVYKIVMSDYIARGGDNCDFLSGLHKRYTNIFLRDAMIAYVQQLEKENKPLHPLLEKRVQYAE